MAFENAVAELAQQQNHHPDITINYRTVSLHITTHVAGILTDKDYTLAEAISLLLTD
jgi:4a-hydroxytetrahydrobiopterin dehydratase